MSIEEILAAVEPRLTRIEAEMAQPDVASDPRRMAALAREHRRLRELLDARHRITRVRKEIDEMREAADDPELAELAAGELPDLEEELARLEDKVRTLLVPEEPEDARNAVLEIRAGTGGEEAALFATDLFKMYARYIESRGWKVKVLDGHFSDLGGVKELLMSVTGEGTYGRLKLESGVHRVQRVPVTEASGRIHTSAATVAVLPEAEEVEVKLDPQDLKIDTFRSSGPGGQHVNKTDSAVRITHLPTGLVVTCQDEKSQIKNKHHALNVLRARLFKRALDEEQNRRAVQRRSQVSSGDRSAKIRTYNFPQNRITDHRVPITIHRLEEVLAGELDLLLNPLTEHFSREKLDNVLSDKV